LNQGTKNMDQLKITENSLQQALITDISTFISCFASCENVTFESFSLKWHEMDFALLRSLASSSQILWSLVQVGLFTSTRPFRDHQLLVFLLFAFHENAAYKISLEKMQLLLNVRLKAKLLRDGDVETALRRLIERDAFVLVAEDFNSPFLTGLSSTQHPSSPNVPSKDQLLERIQRLEAFLQLNPLFDQKLPKASFAKITSLLETYCQAKLQANFHTEDSSELTPILKGVQKIVDGYETLLYKSRAMRNFTSPLSSQQSIRSRLSQTSLNPVIPLSNHLNNNNHHHQDISSDLFLLNRSHSVPVNRMRRASSLNEAALDEFIETSSSTTNMPNINFY
jgi:hypothetical protein